MAWKWNIGLLKWVKIHSQDSAFYAKDGTHSSNTKLKILVRKCSGILPQVLRFTGTFHAESSLIENENKNLFHLFVVYPIIITLQSCNSRYTNVVYSLELSAITFKLTCFKTIKAIYLL